LFEYTFDLLTRNKFDFAKYEESDIELDNNFGDYLKGQFDFYQLSKDDNKQIITDYISGMTDVYAIESIKQITIPKPIYFN